jgi:replicative DNA helicase
MGKYSEELFTKITGEPIQQLKDSNLYFYRDMPMTTAKILQAGMTMKLRFGLEMIIIDYLGILDDDYGNNGYERVGYISRKTKQIARTLDIPIIALHQLHREVEKRENKRPQLSDLRDSGKLEEDADIVLLLYRDSYYTDTPQNMETEVIIAKNRQGVSNHMVGVFYDEKRHIYKNIIKE